MKTDSKRWKDVELGSTVILRGKPWTLESAEKVAGGIAVAVRHRKEVARTTVGKKAVVDVVRSTPIDFGKMLRDQEKAAASKLGARVAAGPRPKPRIEKVEPSGWSASPKGDKTEELIRSELGGVLSGVQLQPGDAYIVSHLDVSTIAGHLFLFHGVGPVDVRKPGGYELAREIHNGEHAEGAPEPRVPHWHEHDRPAVVVGPRFR